VTAVTDRTREGWKADAMAVMAGGTTDTEAALFVERFADGWGRSDPDALLALLSEDIVLKQPMLPDTKGKPQAREAFDRLFRAFPDLRATVHNWAAHGDVVFIDFTMSCNFGGGHLSWPAVDRFVLRDGVALERINYFDPTRLFIQILRRPRGWRNLARALLIPSIR
jgi:ketosteroid isomerase-like protein